MSDLTLVEGVRRREAERLEARIFALTREFSELRNKFEKAERLRPELEERIEGDQLFLKRFNQVDLQAWATLIDQELTVIGAKSTRVSLRYDSTTGRFHGEPGGETLESTGRLLDELLAKEERSGSVSYPIIFTHEEEMNQEAMVASLNFAFLAASFMGQEVGESLELEYKEHRLRFEHMPQVEDIPTAMSFGFVERGESFRHLDEFVRADPSAHWEDWLGDTPLPESGELVLREQGGALLKILIDGEKLLLREEFRPRTELIRKRTNLFAEAQSFRRHDRYFTSRRQMDEGLLASLQERVQSGFRLVFRADGDETTRGSRPA